jgi:hypothetical protein
MGEMIDKRITAQVRVFLSRLTLSWTIRKGICEFQSFLLLSWLREGGSAIPLLASNRNTSDADVHDVRDLFLAFFGKGE